MNGQLLANRAAAQFRLGNFRSALLDCRLALAEDPEHAKALRRAVDCCMELKRFAEAKEFCDKMEPSRESLELRKTIVKSEAEEERNKRRRNAEEKRKRKEEEKVLNAIKERGINVDGDELTLAALEPTHPAAARKRVHFDEEDENASRLIWPVLFMYPEFGETDFIEAFAEDETFEAHLDVMFGEEKAPWDVNGAYKVDALRLFYEDKGKLRLCKVDPKRQLGDVIKEKTFKVSGGTPAFIVLVQDSDFYKEFVKKYKMSAYKNTILV